jgi:hypothetical protein
MTRPTKRLQCLAIPCAKPCGNVRFARWSQWVDATPATNLSSVDLTPKSFWVVCLTGRPLCLDAFVDTSTGWSPFEKHCLNRPLAFSLESRRQITYDPSFCFAANSRLCL